MTISINVPNGLSSNLQLTYTEGQIRQKRRRSIGLIRCLPGFGIAYISRRDPNLSEVSFGRGVLNLYKTSEMFAAPLTFMSNIYSLSDLYCR